MPSPSPPPSTSLQSLAPTPSTPIPTHTTINNPLNLLFTPPLPSHLILRPIQASDRPACTRLLCHAFMYHNPVDRVYGLGSLAYEAAVNAMWEHCWPDCLSFVVVDTQRVPVARAELPTGAVEDERHLHWPVAEHDHDADVDTLSASNIVGVVLNNDGSRQLQWPREDPDFKAAMGWSEDFLLFMKLYQHCDLRGNPAHPLHHLYQPATTPSAPPQHRKGEHLHCFLLATHCHYHSQHLGRYLTQALYRYGQRLGYGSLHVEASHPATAHLFQSGLMAHGVVTHRLAPRDVVKTGEGGEEVRRWEGLVDDVVVVHVKIDQSLSFTLLPYTLSICKLPAGSAVPQWALESSIDLISITRTRHELSILAPTSLFNQSNPPLPTATPTTAPTSISPPVYRALAMHGPLAFGLVGVLERVLRVLATERIAVLAVSTYDTDVVLVAEADVNEAVRVLQCDGHRVLFEPQVASGAGKEEDLAAGWRVRAENGSVSNVIL